MSAFQRVDNMAWPLTVENLNPETLDLPDLLYIFLSLVLSGKNSPPTPKISCLVNSIGQDICYAVTKGKWKLPKHVLLGMALRHLFRSAELSCHVNSFIHWAFSFPYRTLRKTCLWL